MALGVAGDVLGLDHVDVKQLKLLSCWLLLAPDGCRWMVLPGPDRVCLPREGRILDENDVRCKYARNNDCSEEPRWVFFLDFYD